MELIKIGLEHKELIFKLCPKGTFIVTKDYIIMTMEDYIAMDLDTTYQEL